MKKSGIVTMLIAAFAIPGLILGKNTRRRLIKPSRRPVLTAPAPTVSADTVSGSDLIGKIIRISDYQKTVRSRVESFLVTNLTQNDTIKSLTVDLNYTTSDGVQLNRREVTVTTTVPPGETRHVSFTSWDRQQLFYYHLTPPTRPTDRTRPFRATITPVTLVLTAPR